MKEPCTEYLVDLRVLPEHIFRSITVNCPECEKHMRAYQDRYKSAFTCDNDKCLNYGKTFALKVVEVDLIERQD